MTARHLVIYTILFLLFPMNFFLLLMMEKGSFSFVTTNAICVLMPNLPKAPATWDIGRCVYILDCIMNQKKRAFTDQGGSEIFKRIRSLHFSVLSLSTRHGSIGKVRWEKLLTPDYHFHSSCLCRCGGASGSCFLLNPKEEVIPSFFQMIRGFGS